MKPLSDVQKFMVALITLAEGVGVAVAISTPPKKRDVVSKTWRLISRKAGAREGAYATSLLNLALMSFMNASRDVESLQRELRALAEEAEQAQPQPEQPPDRIPEADELVRSLLQRSAASPKARPARKRKPRGRPKGE